MARKKVNIKINEAVFKDLKAKYNARNEVTEAIFSLNVTDIKKGLYAIPADKEEAEDIKKCIIGETITEDIKGTMYIYPADCSTTLKNRLAFIRQYGYDKDE